MAGNAMIQRGGSYYSPDHPFLQYDGLEEAQNRGLSADEISRIMSHPEIITRRRLSPQFNNITHAHDWLKPHSYIDALGNTINTSDKLAETPTKSSLEQLLEKGYKQLSTDRARLSGLNYPAYKGKTTSPMSDLTQRARGLREYYGSKPIPYSSKISSVLSRPTGLSEDSTAGLLERTGGRQRDYGSSLLGHLQKEFRSSYDDRVNRFQRKSGQDINRGIGEFRGKLGDISTLSSNLDQSSNQATAKALQGLSGQKQARRNLLIDNLEQFGKQKHALNNLKLQADKASFDQEARAPHEKANRLEEVLNNANNAIRGEIHPDLEGSMANQINQAMTAYNAPNQKYTGEMIAGSNPELDTSHQLMGGLSSKFRDSFYPERKELTGRLSNADTSVSGLALDKVPDAIRGQIDQLEYAGKKRLKSDLGTLSNKYTRLGQYGSPQHMKMAEERARDLNQATLEQRNKLTEGGLKNQLQMQHQSNIGDIKQLGMLGDLGQQEFGDSIKNIRDLNRLGSTKWQNKQAENEELYKNYMNESTWMWPHMRSQAVRSGRSGAFSELFNTMQNNNISIENLANLNTNYNEIEKERDNYRTQIDNQANQYQGQISSLQSQLDEQRRLLADRQKQGAGLLPPVTRDERNMYLRELSNIAYNQYNPDSNVKSLFGGEPLLQKYRLPAVPTLDKKGHETAVKEINDIANKNKQASLFGGLFTVPAERDPQYNWPILE